MLKQIITLSLAIGLAFSAVAEDYTVQLLTSNRANTNDAKQAVPLPVSIFLLRDNKNFNTSNYFSIEDTPRQSLGPAFIKKSSTIMLPGSTKRLTISGSNARYIAVIGGYNNLKGKRWRRIVRISELRNKDLAARFNNSGIQINYIDKPETDRSSFYADASLGASIVSAESNIYQNNRNDQSTLEINKQNGFGILGMGMGYQWQFGRNSWMRNIGITKFSTGFSFYFMPLIDIEGNVIANLASSSDRLSNNFKLNATSEQMMLEAKINFLRFAKHFSLYTSTGIGSVTYKANFTKITEGGIELETNTENTDTMYKLGFGVEYDYDQNLGLSLGYEYNSPTEMHVQDIADVGDNFKTKPVITINNSNIMFKMRYLF